jgi:hypothetical protein
MKKDGARPSIINANGMLLKWAPSFSGEWSAKKATHSS